MDEVENLLRESGYSDKAIAYYMQKVNVGVIDEPSVRYSYTGPCGDTMEFYLKIKDDVIQKVKFQAIGCAGAFTAGSALSVMIIGKTLEQAVRVDERDILNHLGRMPEQKIHCICLAKRTLERAIEHYRQEKRK